MHPVIFGSICFPGGQSGSWEIERQPIGTQTRGSQFIHYSHGQAAIPLSAMANLM